MEYTKGAPALGAKTAKELETEPETEEARSR
jgi:hypothetical protein